MAKVDLNCPHCDANMIKSYGSETKFRTKLIRWDLGGMFAVCKGCGEDVAIGFEMLKSIQSSFVFEVGEKKIDKGLL
jgi:hypothetical protein